MSNYFDLLSSICHTVIVGFFAAAARSFVSLLGHSLIHYFSFTDRQCSFLCSLYAAFGSNTSRTDWLYLTPGDNECATGRLCVNTCQSPCHLTLTLPHVHYNITDLSESVNITARSIFFLLHLECNVQIILLV